MSKSIIFFLSNHILENPVDLLFNLKISLSYSLQSISPICLPDEYADQDLVALLNSLDPVVVGWGATQTYGPAETVLRQATVPLVTQASCAQSYSGVNVNIGQNKVCGIPFHNKKSHQSSLVEDYLLVIFFLFLSNFRFVQGKGVQIRVMEIQEVLFWPIESTTG